VDLVETFGEQGHHPLSLFIITALITNTPSLRVQHTLLLAIS
jgi:hypothetical protein